MGQSEHDTEGVIEANLGAPEFDPLLWAEGWDGWKAWQAVPPIAGAVQREQQVRAKDPAQVAEYTGVRHEMMADGVLEPWEEELLEGLRADLTFSAITHAPLLTDFQPLQSTLLAVAVDAESTRRF